MIRGVRRQLWSFVRNCLGLRYRELTMAAASLVVIVGTVGLYPGPGEITRGFGGSVSAWLLGFLAVVAVAAGLVKGMSGFGYALVTTPIYASVIDPAVAVVVLAVPPWMTNIFQIGETNTGLSFVRAEWHVLALAVVGSVLGVTVLAQYSTSAFVPLVIGVFLLGYVVFEVATNFVTIDGTHHPVALGAVGLSEGFLLGVANLGPLLPPYYHTFRREVDKYVGSLSMIYLTIFTVRIAQMTLFTDLLSTYRLWFGCAISVVTIVGLVLGTHLRRSEIDERKFNWVVIALLLAIALNLVREALASLLP